MIDIKVNDIVFRYNSKTEGFIKFKVKEVTENSIIVKSLEKVNFSFKSNEKILNFKEALDPRDKMFMFDFMLVELPRPKSYKQSEWISNCQTIVRYPLPSQSGEDSMQYFLGNEKLEKLFTLKDDIQETIQTLKNLEFKLRQCSPEAIEKIQSIIKNQIYPAMDSRSDW